MLAVEKARLFYPGNDPVHGFDHVLRVAHLAERLALAEGADLEIVQAAALLHDGQRPSSGGSSKHEKRSEHHQESADLADEVLCAEGWPTERIQEVQHCIRAHRFRDRSNNPDTLEAMVLFDADKLDAIGAIGAARAIAFAVGAGQPLYATPSPSFLQTGITVQGEPHSAYHEYLFKLIKIKDFLFTSTARDWAEKRQLTMVEFFQSLADECNLE